MDNTDIIGSSNATEPLSVSPRRGLSLTEFKAKVRTLIKQIYELVTLCNVPGCLVIPSPDGTETFSWPESKEEIWEFTEQYFSKFNRVNNNGFESDDVFAQSSKGLSDNKSSFLSELDDKIEFLRNKIESAKFEINGRECGEEDVQILNVPKSVLEKEELDDGLRNSIEPDNPEKNSRESLEELDEDVLEDEDLSRMIEFEKNNRESLEEDLSILNVPERFEESDEDSSEEKEDEIQLLSSFDRINETFKKSINGKRKFEACTEGERDDVNLKKAKQLNIPHIKKLLQELAVAIDGVMMDTEQDEDDGTELTLGR